MSMAGKATLLGLMALVVVVAVLLEEEARYFRVLEPRIELPEALLVDWLDPKGPPTPALVIDPNAKPLAPPAPRFESYSVQSGDSLSRIAARFLGSGTRWRELAELNKDQVPESGMVREGQVLKIPAVGAR